MSPITAPGAKAATLDFRKSLLGTFAINEKANQLLLGQLADAACRLRRLRAGAARLELLPHTFIMYA